MRTIPFALFYFVIGVGFCLTAPQARATTLFISISPDTVTGSPGDTLQFFGTLTNTTAATVFVSGDTFVFSSGTVDDSPFLLGPVSLGPNEISSSFEMFDVTIPVDLAPGTYDGTFNVEGGPDSNADDLLGAATFHVEVDGTAVPEPTSAALVLFGAAVLLWPLRTKLLRRLLARPSNIPLGNSRVAVLTR
jgi:hypothetical protein